METKKHHMGQSFFNAKSKQYVRNFGLQTWPHAILLTE